MVKEGEERKTRFTHVHPHVVTLFGRCSHLEFSLGCLNHNAVVVQSSGQGIGVLDGTNRLDEDCEREGGVS